MKKNFIKFFLFLGLMLTGIITPFVAYSQEGSEYPNFYIRGEKYGDWSVQENMKFERNGYNYVIHLESLSGLFKISDEEWHYEFGANVTISHSTEFEGVVAGDNIMAENLGDVTISFTFNPDTPRRTHITVTVGNIIDPIRPDVETSGTLPVLYINVYDENGNYNNEIISKDLSHKNYFSGVYWLDMNGCQWLEDEGGVSIGDKDNPLPLEIKARGNYTRQAFSKKPFKLKLGKKQSLLGMTKSKHYAILAHADDNFGYMRNFTGFNLGKRIELPWTPWQQPIEVVINGDYRGLYFLTESIRVGDDRIKIQELEDNVTEPSLVSGGYVVELDNYDEENQIRMEEKGMAWSMYRDVLRITFDTPELYSDIQRRFVEEQFNAMNDAIGENSDRLWKYMDLDDAARYYIVEEIISHTESYHGSTYMFRDRGENQKWHFSPLWDCGNAFNGSTDQYFTETAPFGNTWIASLRLNDKFMSKVRETWKWFMSQKFDGLYEELEQYAAHVQAAADADYKRWNGQPVPNFWNPQSVIDNRNMNERLNNVKNHLSAKINWLTHTWGGFGDYVEEPGRDDTEAAELPNYIMTGVEEVINDMISGDEEPEIYNLQGMKVSKIESGNLYIIRNKKGKGHVVVK